MPVEIAGKAIEVSAMRGREIERGAVTAGQQRFLVRPAAMPHRTDRVDDVLGLEPVAARDLGRAGLAAAERLAFLEQFRPGGAMDGAVDAAAAQQRAVGGVDDGADLERGDVGDHNIEPRLADFGAEQWASS